MARDLKKIRAQLEEAIRHAESDESFRADLRKDPAKALSKFDLDPEVAQVLHGDLHPDAELGRMFQCNDYTCWSSRCPGTCAVTVCHTTFWW